MKNKRILPTILDNKKMKNLSEIEELMQKSCHLIERKRYPLVFGNKLKRSYIKLHASIFWNLCHYMVEN